MPSCISNDSILVFLYFSSYFFWCSFVSFFVLLLVFKEDLGVLCEFLGLIYSIPISPRVAYYLLVFTNFLKKLPKEYMEIHRDAKCKDIIKTNLKPPEDYTIASNPKAFLISSRFSCLPIIESLS